MPVCVYLYMYIYICNMYVDVCGYVCTCMYVHEHIYMYITYRKDCFKMTSLWFNVTSCPVFICEDGVISPPTARE